MKILAIEFSSPQRSVAVADTGFLSRDSAPASPGIGGPVPNADVIETGGRATHALAMIEQALRQAQLEREQIECLVIGLGPGSYVGIRAAIAAAQGWQLASVARGIKLLGVSSAECLAAQAQAEGLAGRVAVVIDAQRKEFYLAEYELSGTARRELHPLRLATLADVQERQQAGALLVGPEVANWFADSKALFPRASTLTRLAASRTDFVAAEQLEPIYLRETQFVKAPPTRILPS